MMRLDRRATGTLRRWNWTSSFATSSSVGVHPNRWMTRRCVPASTEAKMPTALPSSFLCSDKCGHIVTRHLHSSTARQVPYESDLFKTWGTRGSGSSSFMLVWVVGIWSSLSHSRGRMEGSDSARLRIGVSRSHFRVAKPYDIFGNGKPGDEEHRKAWEKEMDEETCLWTGSDSEDEELRSKALKRHFDFTDSEGDNPEGDKKNDDLLTMAKEEDEGGSINADDSDELRSVWSGSDEEKTLWTGSEGDDDDDIPTPARPHERSDRYLDKVFEFEEAPRFKTLAELIKGEPNKEELSPGRQARKIAMENALKKLKKGPDGRYTNVWEVITDLDVLIGSFENIVSGPEYADLRAGGPKKLNMQFFRDLQERLRNGTFEFTPEIKLKPKSKFVLRKKWLRHKARMRKLNQR